MKYRCQICNRKCEDNYKEVNELNRRIYCDYCVRVMNIKQDKKKFG